MINILFENLNVMLCMSKRRQKKRFINDLCIKYRREEKEKRYRKHTTHSLSNRLRGMIISSEIYRQLLTNNATVTNVHILNAIWYYVICVSHSFM